MAVTSGSAARKKASLHPVHSLKCSHKTGGRLSLVRAWAILGIMVWESPSAAATPPQYFKKVRLEMW